MVSRGICLVNFWAGSEADWAGISLFEGGCDVALFPITRDIPHLRDCLGMTEWQWQQPAPLASPGPSHLAPWTRVCAHCSNGLWFIHPLSTALLHSAHSALTHPRTAFHRIPLIPWICWTGNSHIPHFYSSLSFHSSMAFLLFPRASPVVLPTSLNNFTPLGSLLGSPLDPWHLFSLHVPPPWDIKVWQQLHSWPRRKPWITWSHWISCSLRCQYSALWTLETATNVGGEVPWERRSGKSIQDRQRRWEGWRRCTRNKQSEGCSDPDSGEHFSHVKNAGLGEAEGGCGGAWPENCYWQEKLSGAI